MRRFATLCTLVGGLLLAEGMAFEQAQAQQSALLGTKSPTPDITSLTRLLDKTSLTLRTPDTLMAKDETLKKDTDFYFTVAVKDTNRLKSAYQGGIVVKEDISDSVFDAWQSRRPDRLIMRYDPTLVAEQQALDIYSKMAGFDGRSDAQKKNTIALNVHNYPNPFNGSTVVEYQVPQACVVTLRIFNLLGQVVREYAPEAQAAGIGRKNVTLGNLPSGIYFFDAQGENTTSTFRGTQKLIYTK